MSLTKSLMTFATAALVILGGILLYKQVKKVPTRKSAVSVVDGITADKFIQEFGDRYHQGEAQHSSDFDSVAQKQANARITQPFVRELHRRSLDRKNDPQWSQKSSTRLREMVKNVPYLVQKPDVQCGSTDCEVTVVTASGLTDYNKNLIVNILAQPAYGDDKERFLVVRQIWSNKDIGEEGSGFHAFYMKRE